MIGIAHPRPVLSLPRTSITEEREGWVNNHANIEHLLFDQQCAKNFRCIISPDPHTNSQKYESLLAHFTNEQTRRDVTRLRNKHIRTRS